MSSQAATVSSFPQHDKVIAWALEEARDGVHEVPMGSNRGPRVQHYQSADWIQGGGYPWCVCFWLCALRDNGVKWPYPSPGAYHLFDWCKKNGRTTANPKPGDGVCFNMGSGHWGIFLRFEGADVVTVDGNRGDRVGVFRTARSSVRGYATWNERAVVQPVVTPPLYDIATSVSGHRKFLTTQRGFKAVNKVLPKLIAKHGSVTITPRRKKKKAKASENQIPPPRKSDKIT